MVTKIDHYLSEIDAGVPYEVVSAHLITENEKLLKAIAQTLYEPFSKTIADYMDVYQEVCIAVYDILKEYESSNIGNCGKETRYFFSAVRYCTMRNLNKNYSYSGFKMSNTLRLKLTKGIDSNPFVSMSLNELNGEDDSPRENFFYMPASKELSPEDAYVEKEELEEIKTAMSNLSDEEKYVMMLTCFNGLTVRAAANVMDVSKSKVQNTKAKAVRNIQKMVS